MTKQLLSILAGCFIIFTTSAQTDVFGIKQMYASKAGFLEWTSAHWNNGTARTVAAYTSDTYDPTDWTEDHSGTSYGFYIDGNGVMKMYGTPRFHINPLRTSKVSAQLFTNIEFTAYYKKKGTSGATYGGMIVGMRGAANGHGSPGGNVCDAQCYMGRFRNDGKWDFEKELKHPGSAYYSGTGYNHQDPLWGGLSLPQNRWIGMKYILTNVNNDTDVRLRLYIDSVSNGNTTGGGVWTLVGDIIDDGTNWLGADISTCTYTDQYMAITAGGNVFLRTDNDTAYYKMVSIREIDPTVSSIDEQAETQDSFSISISDDSSELKMITDKDILKVELISITGQQNRIGKVKDKTINISTLPPGAYILKATTNAGVITRKFVR